MTNIKCYDQNYHYIYMTEIILTDVRLSIRLNEIILTDKRLEEVCYD